MILEVMRRQFVSDSADVVAKTLRQGAESTDAVICKLLEENGVAPADVAAAAEWVESLPPRLGPDVHEDAAYLPGDRDASLVQSALQRYFVVRDLVEHPQAAGAAPIVNPISDVALKGTAAQRQPAQLFRPMEQTDVGWASCLFAQAYKMIAKRHPFCDRPAKPRTIADNARVYVIGDWGSGIARARKIADRIRSMMLNETSREQHVIHLGDVYYSGWPSEYDEHFLAAWPVRPGEESRYGSWCLNANHDMFSGGEAYFDYLLRDSRFRAQEGSSYFSLATSRWLILGLDSAWTEGSLAGGQVEWVADMQSKARDKKLILLTHHQPFSSFGEKSYPDLQLLLARNTVTAWYWGHEHRFALYKPRPNLKYGRLLGHGGVPVWQKAPWKFWTTKIPDDVALVGTKSFRSGLESFSLFGFAVLDFEGGAIRTRYIYETGEEEQPETVT